MLRYSCKNLKCIPNNSQLKKWFFKISFKRNFYKGILKRKTYSWEMEILIGESKGRRIFMNGRGMSQGGNKIFFLAIIIILVNVSEPINDKVN